MLLVLRHNFKLLLILLSVLLVAFIADHKLQQRVEEWIETARSLSFNGPPLITSIPPKYPIKGQLVVYDNWQTIFWFNGKYWLPVRDNEKKYRTIISYGPITMKIKFNMASPPEIREPLLTTGKTDAGDIVYVEYLSDKKVALGIDHWGASGARGKPISIDPNKIYNLKISLGSLYPDVSLNKDLLNKIEIVLDKKVVLEATITFHPTKEEEILVGENKIGGYNSTNRFTGEIKEIKKGNILLVTK